MKTALELPLYRPDRNFKRHPIDVATALRLEQNTLMQEDCQRAGLPLISLDQDFESRPAEVLKSYLFMLLTSIKSVVDSIIC